MFCGIDLAGSEKNPTGICFLNEKIEIMTIFCDEEILEFVFKRKPKVIAIDSPLSFHGKPFRDCDRELRKEFPILPLTFRAMMMLTKRGISLKNKLSAFCVIEVYPHASKKYLKIQDEKDIGVEVKNIHELDAVVCALTAKYFYEGKYKVYGKEDGIVVPQSL
ncbi:MAG: DUF429 domain-containing protein [Candidatus Methanofastidiosia archaeon]